jgi:hypothetical protein
VALHCVLVISATIVALPGPERVSKTLAAAVPVTGAVASKQDLPLYPTGLGAVQASFAEGERELRRKSKVTVTLPAPAVAKQAAVVMNLSQPFIERPVATSLLMAAVGFVGLVVKEGDAVEARKIAVGPSTNDRTTVTSGLAEGERVATDGQYKLRLGSRVTVNPAVAQRNGSS